MQQAPAIAFVPGRFSRRAVLVPALVLVMLLSALPGSTGVAHAAAAPLKAVIIVGPTHDLTASNLQAGETLAQLAESYGMDVRRVFHPKATWANVLAHIQGANLVAYLGHGNGWPSRYSDVLRESTQNGFGLNPYEGAGKNKVEYYGGNKIRNNVLLAANAVVLLNHLCYAAGNGESDDPIPSWSVAHQRVDNFAAAFLYVGAKAVFAYRSGSVATVINQLFTTNKTVEGIFKTTESWSGWNGWDARKLDSARMPGNVNFLDPHSTKGFERAVSGSLGLTAETWRNSPGGGTGGSVAPPPTADTTPPSVPQGLTGTPLGYRRISLTWQASTDDSGGTIKYQVFRNGTKIAATTNLFFTDRPASAGTYKYKVRAKDAAGNKSAFSATISADAIKGELSGAITPDTTPPSVPQGLKAESLGYRRVGLSWQPSSDDRPGTIKYQIFRNGTKIAATTDTFFTDRPDVAGTYKYKVRAKDAAGNKSSFSVVVNGAAVKGAL
jgi:hypothetical protein